MRFDGTIHLGHVVQAVMIGAGLIGLYFAVTTRVTVLEHAVSAANSDRVEIKRELKNLGESINRLAISQERQNTLLTEWLRRDQQ